MKRILITVIAALLTVSTFAQRDKSLLDRTTYFGVRFGLNLSNVSGDATSDMGTSPGLIFGGIMGLSLSDTNPICIETGAFYSERGGQHGSYEYNLNYVEVPVLIKFGFELNEDLLVTPLAGPYFSYAISGKQKEPNKARETSFGVNKFERWDMGFKLGCGAEYKSLYLEAGVQIGMANIHRNPKDAINELTRHGNAVYVQFGINL